MACVMDTSHPMDDDTVSSRPEVSRRPLEGAHRSAQPDEVIIEIAKAIARRLAREEYKRRCSADMAGTAPSSPKLP